MARFRKGTTDHDNSGKMGGSLKAGTRFVPGTTDHDSDGRMGGSLKGDDTMAKKSATKAGKTLLEKGVVKTADIKTTPADETPEAKATKPAKSTAAAKQFAKADAAGEPKRDKDEVAAEELRAGLAMRGY